MRPTRATPSATAEPSSARPDVEVVAIDEQSDQPVDVDAWALLAKNSLIDRGVASGELNLLFVDRAAMTELNSQYMGEPGCTDVLSFPLDTDELDGLDGGPTLLGDIVVCPDYAAEQAPAHAGTYNDELALLIVHGVLHILGMDHAEPDEEAAMQAAEQQLLKRHHR